MILVLDPLFDGFHGLYNDRLNTFLDKPFETVLDPH